MKLPALKDLTGFDHRSLALFRIAFGLTLLGNFYARTRGGRMIAHYTDDGVFPVSASKEFAFGWRLPLMDAFTDPDHIAIAFGFIAAVYLCYTLGLFTRWAKWLVVVILLALYHRNPLVDDGSDSAMRLFAMWTAFFPLGERFSLDVLWKRHRPTGGDHRDPAAIFFVINLSISYYLNAYQKMGGRWSEGLALRDVFWDPMTCAPSAAWVRGWAPDWIIYAMTKGTLVIEYALFATVLLALYTVHARRFTVVAMIALHGMIAMLMDIGSFSYVFLSAALLFIGAEDWNRLKAIAIIDRRKRERVESQAFRAALAVAFAGYCLIMLGLQPNLPAPISKAAAGARGPLAVWAHELYMVPQNWKKFGAPSREPWTTVIVAQMEDGSIRDFLRPGEFSLYRPLRESQHIGKYWVSWMLYITFPQNARYRETMARYLYAQGVKRFWVRRILVRTPDGASLQPDGMREELLFWGERPQVVDLGKEHIEGTTGAIIQRMRGYGKNVWLGDTQLFVAFSIEGQEIDLVFDAERACAAQMTVSYTVAGDYGIARLAHGDSEALIDGYAASGVSRRQTQLPVDITEGRNVVTVTSLGKREVSRGTRIGLDALTVQCIDMPQ